MKTMFRPLITFAALIAAVLIGCAEPNDFPPRPTNTPGAPPTATAIPPTPTIRASATPQPDVVVSTVAPPAPPTLLVGGGADSPTGPALSPIPPSEGGSTDVTMADNGRTVTFQVGQTFLLKLDPDMNWSVSIEDPSVVVQAQTFAAIPGAQGMFVASKAGQTAFSAVGTAICPEGQACPMFAILFKVTIVVK